MALCMMKLKKLSDEQKILQRSSRAAAAAGLRVLVTYAHMLMV